MHHPICFVHQLHIRTLSPWRDTRELTDILASNLFAIPISLPSAIEFKHVGSIATRRGTIYYFGASDVGHLTVVAVVVVFRTFPPFQWPVYVWCAEPRTYLNDDTRRSNEIPENPRSRGKK